MQPKGIQTEAEYQAALKEIERLWDAVPVTPEAAQAEQLTLLIVSMEPVIKPEEALAVVRAAHPYVDFWKVGKLNHNKAVEALVDWRQFRLDIEALFKELSISQDRYYIKANLRKA